MVNKISAKEYPLKKVFSKEFEYHIPAYQRPYAWGKEQAEQLFEDLHEFWNDKADSDEDYFLGSIVLIKPDGEDKPRSDVVDGQQRLTTLTILLAVICKKLSGDNAYRKSLEDYITEAGNPVEEIKPKPRLFLREKDQSFFKKYIQDFKFEECFERHADNLDDEAQRNIQENTKYFFYKIKDVFGSELESLKKFTQFLVGRCYVVAVSTIDESSAFRIFSVLNDRGLDLFDCDIFKADVIGNISAEKQDAYNKKWEDMETELGRESFNELFSYIRMIYVRKKLQKNLINEFRESILSRYSGRREEFFDEILEPYGDMLKTIRKSGYKVQSHAKEVENYLEWLHRIDSNDWIPVILSFMKKYENYPDKVKQFLQKIERLVAYLYLCSKTERYRISRYGKILEISEREDHNFDELLKEITLTKEEKAEFKTLLRGDVYLISNPRKRKYILLRLDSFVSSGEASYESRYFTIEHILPQKIDTGSEWSKLWPIQEKHREWCHKIANLVPLNRKSNSKAQNYDFSKKKEKYLKGSEGTSSYALTTQVLAENVWNEDIVKKRQEKLIEILSRPENWDL